MDSYLKFYEDFKGICLKKGNIVAITYYKKSGEIEECTFTALMARVAALIEKYTETGIRRGDRVAVLIPLCTNAYIDILSLACMGCTSVVLDINMSEVELKRVLDNADVSLCVTTPEIYNSKFEKIELPVVDCSDECIWLNRSTVNNAADPDYEAIAILYSSGTTSQSKGVVIGYEQEMRAMDRLLEVVGTPDIRYLMLFPNSHVSGFTDFLVLLLRGGQLATMEEASAAQIVKGFQMYHPNTFGMVPKVWEAFKTKIEEGIREKGEKKAGSVFRLIERCGKIRSATGINLGRIVFKSVNKQVFGGNLKQVHSGGGKANPEVMRFFYNLGFDTYDFYASTEANIPILVTAGKKFMDSVGNVFSNPNTSIRIWKPDQNGVGEIQVKSSTLMRGYFRDEEATKEAYEDGWFKTGDYGLIKNDELYIKGRVKESIFLKNGEKVSPEDIEYSIEKLIDRELEYAVIGVEEEQGYEHICLCVKADNSSLDGYLDEINKKLPVLYRYSEYFYVEELPKTSVGKVKRYRLKELYRQGQHSGNEKKVVDIPHDESQSLESRIMALIQNISGKADIEIDQKLKQDLGMDSLMLFELSVEVDALCGVDITPFFRNDFTTGDILASLKNGTESDEEFNYADYPVKRTARDWKKFERFNKWTRKHYDFSCEGIENIDARGTYIFAPNHESYFDSIWVMCCLPQSIRNNICSMAADQLFRSPIFKTGRTIVGAIPVHRGGNTSNAMKRIYELLKHDNRSLIIHPEGTRTRTGSMNEFKKGAAELSMKSGICIVPVAVCGSYEIFPHNRKIPRLGKDSNGKKFCLKIVFGKPLKPGDYDDAKAMTADLQQAVMSMKENNRQ